MDANVRGETGEADDSNINEQRTRTTAAYFIVDIQPFKEVGQTGVCGSISPGAFVDVVST